MKQLQIVKASGVCAAFVEQSRGSYWMVKTMQANGLPAAVEEYGSKEAAEERLFRIFAKNSETRDGLRLVRQ